MKIWNNSNKVWVGIIALSVLTLAPMLAKASGETSGGNGGIQLTLEHFDIVDRMLPDVATYGKPFRMEMMNRILATSLVLCQYSFSGCFNEDTYFPEGALQLDHTISNLSKAVKAYSNAPYGSKESADLEWTIVGLISQFRILNLPDKYFAILTQIVQRMHNPAEAGIVEGIDQIRGHNVGNLQGAVLYQMSAYLTAF